MYWIIKKIVEIAQGLAGGADQLILTQYPIVILMICKSYWIVNLFHNGIVVKVQLQLYNCGSFYAESTYSTVN
jgi:hypothetical protein